MGRATKPVVEHGLLLISRSETDASQTIEVGSPDWHAWLATDGNRGFVFRGIAGHFSARREMRRGSAYWYAYRRRDGKLYKAYLGKPDQVNQEQLERTSTRLSGQESLSGLSQGANSLDVTTTLDAPQSAIHVHAAASYTSFLSMTKVTPPGLPHRLVARPRLTRQLDKPVTLICAPSGFGKSTLLNAWQQSCGKPVAWVSLGAEDDASLRFWNTVIAAFQTVVPELGHESLAGLAGSSPLDISAAVASLVDEIAGRPNRRLGLVLDDYHHIQSSQIHASIQDLLEHAPKNLQIVIAGRSRPPLALGRLRATRTVTELETDDLRFTLEEGIDFLVQHTPERPLAFGDMRALVNRTEGWAAGLTLATLALDKHDDQGQWLETFTGAHTYLREYFMESVFSRQPPAVQAFLLKTSILKHLTGPLCNAVTGRTDGEEMLSRLRRENVFVEWLGEENGYRYHDLFAEMLVSQLRAQSQDEIPRLHHRAAEWYTTQNAPADAVYHLLTIEAWEEAASLIEHMALRELEQSGEDSRLLRWLQQLPENVVRRHKTLLSVYVRLARVAMPQTYVEQLLARAEASIMSRPEAEQTNDEQDVLDEIAKIRTIWSSGELITPYDSTTGEYDDDWEILNGVMQHPRAYERRLDQAVAFSGKVYETARARGHLFAMLMAGGGYTENLAWQGRLRQSEEIAHQILQRALDLRGKLPETASIPIATLAHVCYDRNQLVQADQFLSRAVEVDPNPTSTNMLMTIATRRSLIQSALGNHDAARATIQSALELNARRPAGLWTDQELSIHHALICARQGDIDDAERLLDRAAYPKPYPLSNFVRAEIALAQEQGSTAEQFLNRFMTECPHGFRGGPILSARLMLAAALLQQRKVRQSRQVATAAVREAYPEAFVRPFLDYGIHIVPVLVSVLRAGRLTAEAQAFVETVVREIGRSAGEKTQIPEHEWAALSMAASISAREQQVLQSLNAGLSNREIAATLSISECTVKTHLTNIYRKLSVNNRVRAVAQAKTLMLI